MANSKLSCTKISFILNEYKVKENVNSPIGLKVICHSVFSISTAHNLNTTFALTVWIWAETQHVIIYQVNSFFKTNTTEMGTLIRRYFVLAMNISVTRKLYTFCSPKIVTLFDKCWQLLSCEEKKTTKNNQTIWIENSVKIILTIAPWLKCNFNTHKGHFTLLEFCRGSLIINKNNTYIFQMLFHFKLAIISSGELINQATQNRWICSFFSCSTNTL